MASKTRTLGPTTLLALAAFAAALLFTPAAQPAPGDIADLAVTKTDSPDPVEVGETLTYAIQVTNLGPQKATDVVVTDRLPNRTDLISASPESGTCERRGRKVTCRIGDLAPDPANPVDVTIQVRPSKAGMLINSVSVDSVEIDPLEANDRAEATTTVTEPRSSSCRGVPSTITGTPDADRLTGSEGPDVIAGLGSGDVIVGLSGRDLICAGAGNDRVAAGSASDRAFGGPGADRLLGRGGPDLLAGNPGRDVLRGGQGADRLRGGAGLDRCNGGAGLDLERSCLR
ncbi:MAG TPA: hypothetical protein VNO20_04145 [Solirubrobacterales bacterium]|nr:hypothetical protein [Solirubrobacterales bacterium]